MKSKKKLRKEPPFYDYTKPRKYEVGCGRGRICQEKSCNGCPHYKFLTDYPESEDHQKWVEEWYAVNILTYDEIKKDFYEKLEYGR